VVVVFDGEEPDESLCREAAGRRIRVTTNTRTPGLAGARNSGIETLSTELVAFCDDDDLWSFGKLSTQVRRLRAEPDTEMLTCGIVVSFDGRQSPRLAGRDLIEYHQLLPSRLAMLHSSTFLLRRAALLDGIRLLDESIPGSQNEDWDLLLRAARRQPIRHVDEPLVRVSGDRTHTSPGSGKPEITRCSGCCAGIPTSPPIGQVPRACTGSSPSAMPPSASGGSPCTGRGGVCADGGGSRAACSPWRSRSGCCGPRPS